MTHRYRAQASFPIACLVLATLAHPATAQQQAPAPRTFSIDLVPVQATPAKAPAARYDVAAASMELIKQKDGGVQRIAARRPTDWRQIGLIRSHLLELAATLGTGSESATARLYGDQLPGLATLEAANTQQLGIEYRELPDGAELAYSTAQPAVLRALHAWFDAIAATGPHAR